MKTMRGISTVVSGRVAKLTFCLLLVSGVLGISHLPAQAALVQESTLGILGSPIPFEFENQSGSCGTLGPFEDTLDFFAPAGECAAAVVSFATENILTPYASWAIDPGTWLLDLELLFVDTVGGVLTFAGYDIVAGTGVGCEFVAEPFPISLSTPFCDGANETFPITFTPVHEAPEPGSLTLFVVALGGLGFMARRRLTA